MKHSAQVIEIIKYFEGLHDGDLTIIGLQPKMCPAGYWTEGYGSRIFDDKGIVLRFEKDKEKAYKFSKIKTEADALIQVDKVLYSIDLQLAPLKMNLNQNQYDGIVDFSYNAGLAALMTSTLYRKLKYDPNDKTIAYEFSRWNKCEVRKGELVVMPGLVKRRAAEAELYFKPI